MHKKAMARGVPLDPFMNKYLGCIFILCAIWLPACGKKSDTPRSAEHTDLVATITVAKPLTNADKMENNTADETQQHEYLVLTLHNSGNADIDETSICFGKHSCTSGIVGHGTSASNLGWTWPVTTNAVVRWRDAEKIKREFQTDVSSVYDPKLPGELLFTIAGTNVAVTFQKRDRK
jgi:hypothetical protein